MNVKGNVFFLRGLPNVQTVITVLGLFIYHLAHLFIILAFFFFFFAKLDLSFLRNKERESAKNKVLLSYNSEAWSQPICNWSFNFQQKNTDVQTD